MKVYSKQITDTLTCTIYSENGIEIKAVISPIEGNVSFEAYINGEYVMFSHDRKLSRTLLVLNHRLSIMGV